MRESRRQSPRKGAGKLRKNFSRASEGINSVCRKTTISGSVSINADTESSTLFNPNGTRNYSAPTGKGNRMQITFDHSAVIFPR